MLLGMLLQTGWREEKQSDEIRLIKTSRKKVQNSCSHLIRDVWLEINGWNYGSSAVGAEPDLSRTGPRLQPPGEAKSFIAVWLTKAFSPETVSKWKIIDEFISICLQAFKQPCSERTHAWLCALQWTHTVGSLSVCVCVWFSVVEEVQQSRTSVKMQIQRWKMNAVKVQ